MTDKRAGRARRESLSGGSYSRALKRWVYRLIEIDRERDIYLEIVVDPETGDVFHHCHESLKQHRDREGKGESMNVIR